MTKTKSEPKRIRLNPRQRKLVCAVATAYKAMQFLMPVVSANPDESPGSRSPKWTPASCHYTIDVSYAVRDAVANLPDANELLRAWTQLTEDDTVIRETETRLIHLLAPVFEARELEPWAYFRVIRQGGIRRRCGG